ncbi:MAG: nucleotidyltransferase family protein [Candidatus Micrarchaeia archaeon]
MKKGVLSDITSILASYGAKKVSLFGSYARGEEKRGSDIDLVVEFKKKKSLLELVRIENEVSEKVGKKIDLLTEKSISPYVLERIAGERKVLLS